MAMLPILALVLASGRVFAEQCSSGAGQQECAAAGDAFIALQAKQTLHLSATRDHRSEPIRNLSYSEARSAVNPLTMVTDCKTGVLWGHIVANADLPGDILEAGVWKGGTSALMMYADAASEPRGSGEKQQRSYWLYDTFEGLPAPTAEDDDKAKQRWEQAMNQTPSDALSDSASHAFAAGGEYKDEQGNVRWNYAPLDMVKGNLVSTGLKDSSNVKFIKGKVEDTLIHAENVPRSIALMRLDTDWYLSTKKELDVLWPLLVAGGLLQIDDYCWWGGSRRATTEWLANGHAAWLNIIDAEDCACFSVVKRKEPWSHDVAAALLAYINGTEEVWQCNKKQTCSTEALDRSKKRKDSFLALAQHEDPSAFTPSG
eukprot:gnl/TRDRNA2_/TRDRNA2_200124_c0_seq1.p1 gnl/TRDRNA2_/TRDRNA2_200124_c0~~gnl/TRDRNA2_/TRDRNA2_200124_c0_seq1.p1  ORF type:complete len:372 (+),score=52.65 gnl/TRDRNA2_/TRDRNA2_200124_c0_seq1:83-1198(+)